VTSALVRAVVDTRALRSNLGVVRRLAPRSQVMAVVKANAYGHGLVPTALALADADAFAVARLDEGITLRHAGVRAPIVVLEGVFDSHQLNEAARHDFEIVVHSAEQVALLSAWGGKHRFTAWLKVDTGMNRLGFRREEFAAAFSKVQGMKCVSTLRLLTHLADADMPNDTSTHEQLRLFERLTTGLTNERSIANSAGIAAWPDSHVDWVRPGLMLYGVSPVNGKTGPDLGLQPAMTLVSTVIAVKQVLPGERVGYGGRWTARRPTTIAIAAVGYGDGYPRHIANGTPVLVEGHRASVAGRVSMDMIAVDITELPPVHAGASVVLWGKGLPAETVAPHAETIAYELLCGVSQRVALELK
jgi:alanine racemase